MSDNTPRLTVNVLLKELKEVDDWYMLGTYLDVPVCELDKIQSTHTHEGVERCKLQMLRYWLNNSMNASWRDLAEALEHLKMLTLAEKLKSKYLCISTAITPGSTSSVQPSPPQTGDNDPSTDLSTNLSTDPAADSSTHSSAGSSVAALTADVEVVDSDFPDMMTDTRKDLVCINLRSSSSPQPGDTDPSTVNTIKDKKEESLRAATINEFQQAEMSRAVTPREKSTIIYISYQKRKLYSIPFTMKDVGELGKKAFILTCIVLIIAAAVGYHHSCVEQLQEELQIANKLLAPQESELKEMRRRVRDLQKFVLSSSLVQVTGEGKELTTAGKETCFELSLSSQTPSSRALTFLFKHLSCQLTDPHHQHLHCSITSTRPGICTVKYTPTVRGPHQLGITIRDTEIAGSPFTIHVLPSPEMRGEVQLNIPAVQRPWGVAVSKSGEVVVSDYLKHSISVYSREGNKIRSFGSKGSSTGQFQYPRSVAITFDNHILVADTFKHRIQMFTMEGKFVKSVGQKGQEPLQFKYPSGIAVHPSGRVFVTESMSHRIQVLNSDLSYSHMFGSEGSAPGQLSYPRDVAINSSGVVYVTDHNNHRMQLFSADGQFISSLGSKGSQHGQFYNPTGICIDSTNTVYVTDFNHRVSMYTNNGQFIKSFSTLGSGEGELSYPEGVAVDNTTGALYVCDHYNDRVVVY